MSCDDGLDSCLLLLLYLSLIRNFPSSLPHTASMSRLCFRLSLRLRLLSTLAVSVIGQLEMKIPKQCYTSHCVLWVCRIPHSNRAANQIAFQFLLVLWHCVRIRWVPHCACATRAPSQFLRSHFTCVTIDIFQSRVSVVNSQKTWKVLRCHGYAICGRSICLAFHFNG